MPQRHPMRHLKLDRVKQVQYDSMDYSSSDPVMITLTVRFDNATQGSEIAAAASNAALEVGP